MLSFIICNNDANMLTLLYRIARLIPRLHSSVPRESQYSNTRDQLKINRINEFLPLRSTIDRAERFPLRATTTVRADDVRKTDV